MGRQPLESISKFAYRYEMWMEEARCAADPDPDRWASTSLPTRQKHLRVRLAKQRCEGCPVLRQCAEYAVRTESTDHIFAGIPLGQTGSNRHQYEQLRRISEGEQS